MSAPTPRSSRQPLNERSQSQNNTLAIRVVPYSPPRLDDDQTSSASSTAPSALRRPNSPLGQPIPTSSDHHGSGSSPGNWAKTPLQRWEHGGALSPSSSTASLATIKGEGVSGSIGSEAPVGPPGWANTPALNAPPYASNIGQVNAASQLDDGPDSSMTAEFRPDSGGSQHRLIRRRNIIAIHSDKTFSLVPHKFDGSSSSRSARPSFSTTSVSSDPFTDDAPSSPVTTLPERSRSISPCTLASSPTPTLRHTSEDHKFPLPASASAAVAAAASVLAANSPSPAPATSPWNYRMVGGLRKVPKTPDLKRSQPNPVSTLIFPLPRPDASRETTTAITSTPLATKHSFNSTESASSAASETTNYRVHGSSSPYLPDNVSLGASSDDSNYQILGASSSPAPTIDQAPPPSPGSDDNYVVHGDPSPSSSVVKVKNRRLYPQYSQESLLVPPLRPGKKTSLERLGYYKSRSRESLRRVGSLASITSILSQGDTQSLLSTPAAIYLQGGPLALSTLHNDIWGPTSSAPSSSSTSQMIAHPHQWSSQLSTVASESGAESDGEVGSSRAASPASYPARWSSGFPSNHSRQMLSVSSSGQEGPSPAHSRSASDSADRPYPSQSRYGPRDARLVRDQDEHGDGLTDLEALQQRPSRTRLSSFFNLSDRNLHSSASSRANSFSSTSLPAWARLYYGSGERRFLAARSSDSMFSEYQDSRPQSSFRSRSPSTEHFPPNIYSQRRRPREVGGHQPRSSSGSLGIAQIPALGMGMGLRKKTSSVWSPHLRQDQRASRYSIWEPPSMSWSSDSGLLGKRNLQVLMFVVGFAFPFGEFFSPSRARRASRFSSTSKSRTK